MNTAGEPRPSAAWSPPRKPKRIQFRREPNAPPLTPERRRRRDLLIGVGIVAVIVLIGLGALFGPKPGDKFEASLARHGITAPRAVGDEVCDILAGRRKVEGAGPVDGDITHGATPGENAIDYLQSRYGMSQSSAFYVREAAEQELC